MTIIKLSVNGQRIDITQRPVVASGDRNCVLVHADFDAEWSGYIKTAIFYQDDRHVYHSLIDDNNECVIPWEVLSEEGTMYLGILGVREDARKTTEVVRYIVKKGAWSPDFAVSDPTPSIYESILEDIRKVRELTTVKPKRATGEEWEQSNPILEEGELAVELLDSGVGTGQIKIKQGDGFSRWTELPYAIDLTEFVQHLEDTDNPHGVTLAQIGGVDKVYVDSKHFFKDVVLVAADWEGDSAPFTITLPVEGIQSSDRPHYGPVYSDDAETAVVEKEAWMLVDDLITGDGFVEVHCFEEKPVVDITVQLEVMR